MKSLEGQSVMERNLWEFFKRFEEGERERGGDGKHMNSLPITVIDVSPFCSRVTLLLALALCFIVACVARLPILSSFLKHNSQIIVVYPFFLLMNE